MIKSVTIINDQDEELYLPLSDPYQTGMVIAGIDGLGPPKANINTTELASSDGAVYNSSRITTRNIVFTFKLLPDPTTNLVETSRLRTYQFFPLKANIVMIFETDHRDVMTEGYVESNEPNIFSQDEEVKVSIVCPSPFFYANDSVVTLNGINSEFTFPFSNESLTENLINLGEIVFSVGTNYIYEGDTDSGIIIRIHFTGDCTNPSVYNAVSRERMDIDSSKVKTIIGGEDDDFIAGDDVIISSISGSKSITLVRGGISYNILATLPKLTDWVLVHRGNNVFGCMAGSGLSNMVVNIQTQILYEGV